MSRIGKMPVPVPQGVQVELGTGFIRVQGPMGQLERPLHEAIEVKRVDDLLVCVRPSDSREHRSLHGLVRALVANMVHGVTEGFAKELILNGVGYRAQVDGRRLGLAIGLSHPVDMEIPVGLDVEVTALGGNRHRLVVKGISKESVGQFAADIRKLRPVEPYNEKGFRYGDEVVRRKAGKSAVGGGAPGSR